MSFNTILTQYSFSLLQSFLQELGMLLTLLKIEPSPFFFEILRRLSALQNDMWGESLNLGNYNFLPFLKFFRTLNF